MQPSPPRRWLITGGGGFLGQNLVRVLRPEDGEVVVVARHAPYWPLPSRVQCLECDVRDVDAYRSFIDPETVVVHLASSSYPGRAELMLEADIQDNILATVRLANACADAHARAFLFASTGGALYGDQGRTAIAESAPTRPVSAYGVLKLSSEHYLRVLNELRGLPIAFLRMSNPFGLWHGRRAQGALNVFAERVRAGEPIDLWGDGSHVRDYVFAEDVAHAIRAVGLGFRSGCEAYHIGSGEGQTLAQMIDALFSFTGRRVPVRSLPRRPVDVAYNVLDCTKIRDAFGWTASTPFVDGMRRTWEWTCRHPSSTDAS